MDRRRPALTPSGGGHAWPLGHYVHRHIHRVRVRLILHIGVSFLGWASAGAFIGIDGCVAQALTTPDSARLTVRPRAMATGARTAQAGEFPMDSFLPRASMYVPPQCVGTRRCPLVVAMEGGLSYQRRVADRYGMIFLLVPTETGTEVVTAEAIRLLDANLKYLLQHFAIDPDRIAVVGNCHSGPPALFLGGLNLAVFSRIIAFSGSTVPPAGMDPRNTDTEILIGSGYLESESDFAAVQAWRRAGHPVTQLLSIKSHGNNANEYDFMGRWLQQSWAIPKPADRPAPPMVADSLPVLTTEVLTRMTAFWERFMQEPDSLRTTWDFSVDPDATPIRRTDLREVIVPVGTERPSVWMTDMAALAARYPSVAADLEQAGLTAQQHDAYRAALLSASVARQINTVARKAASDSAFAAEYQYSPMADAFGAPRLISPLPTSLAVAPASVLAKNIVFLEAHPDELAALEATGTWRTP